ncbi:helix-turn-helix domain-containing protein [Streptomyces sp. NPDC003343]
MRETNHRIPSARPGRLQSWLRNEKQRSGLSFGELAARTFVSKSALHRATQGSGLPSREVFDAFVVGCGSDVEDAEEQWRWAEMINGLTFGWELARTSPEAATTHGELREALARLTEKSGRSLRELENRSRAQGGALRRSTLSDALLGRHKFGRRMVAELAQTCGETADAVTAWDEAWQRAERERRGRTGHMGAVRRLPSDAREIIELGVAEMFRIGDRHGISDTDIEVYIRDCAARERRWNHRTYWTEPPEAWTRAVSGPIAGLSRRLDEALSSVLTAERNRTIDEETLSRIAQAVMKAVVGADPVTVRQPVDDSPAG